MKNLIYILLLFSATITAQNNLWWQTTSQQQGAISEQVVTRTPTIYVSSSTGSDSNGGLTDSTPFATTAKAITEASAGDVVAFKSGDIWNERFYLTKSGTVNDRITFTSYGSGDKPIFDVSSIQSLSWSDTGTDVNGISIWYTSDETSNPKRLMIDGIERLGGGNNYSELGELVTDRVEWFYGTGGSGVGLYIWSSDSPANHTIKYASSDATSQNRLYKASNITINNLEFRGATKSYCLNQNGGQNVTIENCKIGAMSLYGYRCTDVDQTGNDLPDNVIFRNNTIDAEYAFDYSLTSHEFGSYDGIRIDGLTNSLIHDNYIKNWGHASISHTLQNIDNDYNVSDNRVVSGNKYYNNYCTAPDITYGGRIGFSGNIHDNEFYNNQIIDVSVRSQMNGYNNHIHHNIFKDIRNSPIKGYDTGEAIGVQGYSMVSEGNIFEHNLFYNTASSGFLVSGNNALTDVTNHIIRNNIFYNCGTGGSAGYRAIWVYGDYNTYSNDGNTFQNNLIYNSETTAMIGYHGSIITVEAFNALNGDSTNVMEDNIIGNPLFVSTTDFHLQSGSPAIDTGTTALSILDYEGNTVPYSTTNPDIGIYESQSENPYVNLDTTTTDYSIPALAKPAYMASVVDPTFGTTITRIVGDTDTEVVFPYEGSTWNGKSVPAQPTVYWRNISRQGYNLRQAWNADQTIMRLEKIRVSGGSWEPELFLDGNTYEPLMTVDAPSYNEIRWHPTDPDLMLILRDNGTWTWNIWTDAEVQTVSWSGYTNCNLGASGNWSDDGNKLGLLATRTSDSKLVIFACDASTGNKSADIDMSTANGSIDDAGMSATGDYIHSNGDFVNAYDETRLWTWDGGNGTAPVLHDTWINTTNGYGEPSHYDVTQFGGEDYAVGGDKGNSGEIIARKFLDGTKTELYPAGTSGWHVHTSARNINKQGYALSSTSPDYQPYYDELVITRLGGGNPYRVAKIRHSLSGYDNETQPIFSPNGDKIVFCTDWGTGALPIQAYIIELP